MKTYPSIPKTVTSERIFAFDKLDGSNLRVEWSRKSGFYKWGTRRRLLDPDEDLFGQGVDLFMEKYSEDLEKIATENQYRRCTYFFEFFGPYSFAGNHLEGDDFDVVLFDVSPYKKGIIGPRKFIDTYGHLDIPAILYEGKADQPFIKSVKKSELDGMTFEGVVCKGKTSTFKVKSQAWLDALKQDCGDDEQLFNKRA